MRFKLINFLAKINKPFNRLKIYRIMKKKLKLNLLISRVFFHNLAGTKANFGELNPDKTFYVISGFNAGLYSIIHFVIGHIIFALKKGYIPIVDYENFESSYTENSAIQGTRNVWEYYFHQPCDYDLSSVFRSKNVVFSKNHYPYYYHKISDHIINLNPALILKYNAIFNTYIKYNNYVNNLIIDTKRKLLNSNSNILGVYSRGTDYNVIANHNLQPTLNELLNEVEIYLSKYDIDYIFVSTEEEFVLKKFIEKYHEKVIFTNRLRVENYDNKTPIPNWTFERENNNYRAGLEYLIDVELCSSCDYFISGISGGSVAIIEKNGLKFKDMKVIFKGVKYK